MRRYRISVRTLTATGALLIGLPMCASRPSDSNVSTMQPAPAKVADSPEVKAARVALSKMPLGTVASRDARGVASFVWASEVENAPELKIASVDAARLHLERHAKLLGLNTHTLREAVVLGEQPIGKGASIVSFGQREGGVEIWGTRSSVILSTTKQLVAISGNLFAAKGTNVAERTVTASQSIARAFAAQFGRDLPESIVRETGTDESSQIRNFEVKTTGDLPRLRDGASVKSVLYPVADRLEPAFYAEFISTPFDENKNQGWGYVISAVDGRVLLKRSITQREAFNYRVFANATGDKIPFDGPLLDYTPNPNTGDPTDVKIPSFVAPQLVSMDGFNKNPLGTFDPWLTATDTVTSGNNVDAYSDRNSEDSRNDAGIIPGNGYDPGIDIRPDTTAAHTFDRTYDTSKEPNVTPDQIKAAVTNLFYITNWMHDYWYDSGFNEAAGNAQKSNYSRGGVENDALLAEGQDGADVGLGGNANMSTPSDGKHPRMQMYVWDGFQSVTLTATPAVAFADLLQTAGFGPDTFDVTFPAVVGVGGPASGADGGALPTNLGCGTTQTDAGAAAPVPLTNVSGKIAILDRGVCQFTEKARNAQAGGAKGLIVVNNVAGHDPAGVGGSATGITVPVLGISLEDGALLKTAIGAGAVSLHMVRKPGIKFDGTIDNSVIAHEWGHYLHHRLVDCGKLQCNGMSEGWGDFNALMMVIKDGDAWKTGTYALAQYDTRATPFSSYFGIRRAPYSYDKTKNPLSYKYVAANATLPDTAPIQDFGDNSESHNVGEIWAQSLFDGYVNLLTDTKATPPRFDFATAKRRMANYVVGGMKAAPAEPTFTQQRDAILAVAYAADKLDFKALANGFAGRGLGVGAVSPPIGSADLNEAVESDKFIGETEVSDIKLEDNVKGCDGDGILDPTETGKLSFTVKNVGWLPLATTTVKVTSALAGVTLSSGGTITIPALDPFQSKVVSFDVNLAKDTPRNSNIALTINAAAADAFTTSHDFKFEAGVAADVAPAASATDDVESEKPVVWSVDQIIPTSEDDDTTVHGPIWTRQGTFTHYWHGDDSAFNADASLVSPELTVSATEPFKISLDHAYSFEFDADANYDGAVIEIQVKGSGPTVGDAGGAAPVDGGASNDAWQDISQYAASPYGTNVVTEPNPTQVLHGRPAFTGTSDGYPALKPLSLDLGTKLAGKTVRVRFRIGTDPAAGFDGWNIDNIAFSGITNKPFSTLVDNSGVCSVVATDGGTGDGGGESTGGESSTGGSTKPPPVYSPVVTGDGDSNCSCSTAVGHSTRVRDYGMALTALGGLALVVGRRRRRNAA